MYAKRGQSLQIAISIILLVMSMSSASRGLALVWCLWMAEGTTVDFWANEGARDVGRQATGCLWLDGFENSKVRVPRVQLPLRRRLNGVPTVAACFDRSRIGLVVYWQTYEWRIQPDAATAGVSANTDVSAAVKLVVHSVLPICLLDASLPQNVFAQ